MALILVGNLQPMHATLDVVQQKTHSLLAEIDAKIAMISAASLALAAERELYDASRKTGQEEKEKQMAKVAKQLDETEAKVQAMLADLDDADAFILKHELVITPHYWKLRRAAFTLVSKAGKHRHDFGKQKEHWVLFNNASKYVTNSTIKHIMNKLGCAFSESDQEIASIMGFTKDPKPLGYGYLKQ